MSDAETSLFTMNAFEYSQKTLRIYLFIRIGTIAWVLANVSVKSD